MGFTGIILASSPIAITLLLDRSKATIDDYYHHLIFVNDQCIHTLTNLSSVRKSKNPMYSPVIIAVLQS